MSKDYQEGPYKDPNASFERYLTEIDMISAIKGYSTDDMIEWLRSEHPEYTNRKEMYKEHGDVALNRLSEIDVAEALLEQFKTEPDPFYECRKVLSKFLPETPAILDKTLARCFQFTPKRTFPDKEPKASMIAGFIDAAGRDETTLTDEAKQAARFLAIYGSVDVVLDHLAGAPTEAPYITLYTPEDRLNWEPDMSGGFKWVKYCEYKTSQEDVGGSRVVSVEYRIICAPKDGQKGYTATFRIIEDNGKEICEAYDATSGEYVDYTKEWLPVENDFHKIPVVTAYYDKVCDGIGIPWVTSMVRADVKCYRQESDIVWDTSIHAHPWLKFTGESLKDLNLGKYFAVHLKPKTEELGPEELEYLVLDSTPIELQRAEADITRKLVRYYGGSKNTAENEDSESPESGLAKSIRISEETIICIRLSSIIAELEWKILELALLEGEQTEVDLSELSVIYPDKFDQRSKEELTLDLTIAKSLGNSTLILEIEKSLATLLLGSSASAEMIQKIHDEMDIRKEEPIEEIIEEDEEVIEE